MSFALQKLSSFMRSHLSILDLRVWAIGVCLGNSPLCQWVQGSFPFPLLLDSVYLVLCWGPWSTWTWTLCKVTNIFIFIFLYTDSKLDQHHLLKMLSLFHCIFLASLSKIKYLCVVLFLGLQLYSIDQHVCLCNTMQLFITIAPSKAWSQGWWSPQSFLYC